MDEASKKYLQEVLETPKDQLSQDQISFLRARSVYLNAEQVVAYQDILGSSPLIHKEVEEVLKKNEEVGESTENTPVVEGEANGTETNPVVQADEPSVDSSSDNSPEVPVQETTLVNENPEVNNEPVAPVETPIVDPFSPITPEEDLKTDFDHSADPDWNPDTQQV